MNQFSHSCLATFAGAIALFISSGSAGANSSLFEYAINADGIFSSSAVGSALAPLAGQTAFNFNTGVGMLTFTMNGSGEHYFGVFFDHGIDERLNTYFNEYALVSGQASAGQSWEVNEPGYAAKPGEIFYDLQDRTLDNKNWVPAKDDVSMAMAWNFTLQADQQAQLQFLISSVAPLSGFYLQQTDPASHSSLYFSSSLTVTQIQVPEAITTLPLLCFALGSLMAFGRFRLRPRSTSEFV